MAKNFVAHGDIIDHTAAANIASGAVVALGDTVGVALEDIPSGFIGPVKIEGVFQVAKATSQTWSPGEKLNWDASAGRFTTGATAAGGDVTAAGVVYAPAAAGDAVGQIKLTPGTGTGT